MTGAIAERCLELIGCGKKWTFAKHIGGGGYVSEQRVGHIRGTEKKNSHQAYSSFRSDFSQLISSFHISYDTDYKE